MRHLRLRLDGVYLAQRDYLIEKFKDVAKSLLNKEHTTKRTRGLLMEEVSEIDAGFKDIYERVWAELSEENRQKLITYLEGIVAGRAERAMEKSEEFPTNPEHFSCRMKFEFLSKSYDTYTRWRFVHRMLGYLECDLGEGKRILKEFRSRQEEDSLLELRNNYAHKTRLELEKDHSLERCVIIRRELRRQQDNIDHIVNSVGQLSQT